MIALSKSTVSMASVIMLIIASVAVAVEDEESPSTATATATSTANSSSATVTAIASNSATASMVWMVVCAGIAVTLLLLRASIDLIQTASQSNSQHFQEAHHGNNKKKAPPAKTYGSVDSGDKGGETSDDSKDKESASNSETESLLGSATADSAPPSHQPNTNLWSLGVQLSLAVLFWFQLLIGDSVAMLTVSILPKTLVAAAAVTATLSTWLVLRDLKSRQRFGVIARVLNVGAALALYTPTAILYYSHRHETANGDEVMYTSIALYCLCIALEALMTPYANVVAQSADAAPKKRALSSAAIFALLKPYVWPDESSMGSVPGQPSSDSSSPTANRIRAVLTWVCVLLSKVCNLASPILLGHASTALAHQDYKACITNSIGFAVLGLLGSTFKEFQSLIYLKVAQAAYVQLSQTTFCHLHSLSLDWHLRKKLGEVIRSMDRGIAACDTLMKYLFLWLLPALIECFVVCIIFATYFHYLPLAISVFYFVWIYIVWTILVTLWRKKFRKAVVKSDNEWHDRCTDSLINFETVKYFTAEEYEARRFGEAVSRYQAGSVNVQASLSFLNISQKLLLQICLAMALSLSALGIQKRIDCCLEYGCESGVSECCQAIPVSQCPGMQVGDFVAVLTYTIQLFAPLNFLGSVYNAIVMAVIDLANLSELLAESPDVTDAPGAMPVPYENTTDEDSDIAVEFENVVFRYPTQPENKGLKGISFTMKRGTTTAIVGPTGAGKTTISRLFFRFYDVLGGAIKVNGCDVRAMTQKSLRGAIGVVPQAASMFNDTIYSNLMYGRRTATHEDIIEAARDAQLLDFIESLEDGWETSVGDRGLKLSGGEKQRAAIARCLLKDPPFVLLDEATSALDTLTEKSVQESLDRLSGTGGDERTVLVIAHRLGTIRNADNIVVLKDGLIAEQGTHDELLNIPNGTYAEMWNMQLHADESRAGSKASLASALEAVAENQAPVPSAKIASS